MVKLYINDDTEVRLFELELELELDLVEIPTGENGMGIYPITGIYIEHRGESYVSDRTWSHNWRDAGDEKIFETPRDYGERMIAAIRKRGWIDTEKWTREY